MGKRGPPSKKSADQESSNFKRNRRGPLFEQKTPQISRSKLFAALKILWGSYFGLTSFFPMILFVVGFKIGAISRMGEYRVFFYVADNVADCSRGEFPHYFLTKPPHTFLDKRDCKPHCQKENENGPLPKTVATKKKYRRTLVEIQSSYKQHIYLFRALCQKSVYRRKIITPEPGIRIPFKNRLNQKEIMANSSGDSVFQ